jgi:tetratricopeptide (TPR) repeat protein
MLDLQVRRLRQQAVRAKQTRGESPETEQQYRRLRKELTAKEVDRCQFLCQRYPHNLRFKYDLGLVYQIDKQYNEAIKEYQQARNDPRSKGLCLLRLGQCFQAIKQNRLAVTHYETALEEIPDRDAQNKKEALYLAGKLAMELNDLDKADKHLGVLAGLDFTYKDVSQLLDELGRRREEGPDGSGDNA